MRARVDWATTSTTSVCAVSWAAAGLLVSSLQRWQHRRWHALQFGVVGAHHAHSDFCNQQVCKQVALLFCASHSHMSASGATLGSISCPGHVNMQTRAAGDQTTNLRNSRRTLNTAITVGLPVTTVALCLHEKNDWKKLLRGHFVSKWSPVTPMAKLET